MINFSFIVTWFFFYSTSSFSSEYEMYEFVVSIHLENWFVLCKIIIRKSNSREAKSYITYVNWKVRYILPT